LFKLHH